MNESSDRRRVHGRQRSTGEEWHVPRSRNRTHVAAAVASGRHVPHPPPAEPPAEAAHRTAFGTVRGRRGRSEDAALLPLRRHGQHGSNCSSSKQLTGRIIISSLSLRLGITHGVQWNGIENSRQSNY